MSITQRDELAAIIVSAYGEDADELCPCEQDFQVAEAILAAGYRKPVSIFGRFASPRIMDKHLARRVAADLVRAGYGKSGVES